MSKRREIARAIQSPIQIHAEVSPFLGYEARRAQAAREIMPFIRGLIRHGQTTNVTFDRAKVLLYLDAMRVDLMPAVEADDEFTYDDKVYFSQLISGLNKGWPQILRLFRDERESGRLVAMGVSLALGVGQILDAFAVRLEADP